MNKRKYNRLINEKSPYLQQHATNPVDWYPWSQEAFETAKREDKPIFLSIGYSACHWCHVMEKESFEDKQVADLLNNNFICIKVDREERPDIDKTYMAIAQILANTSGWPLTIIMTPERKPFFASTYIPKQDAYGRVGMVKLLPRIREIWDTKREEVLKSSDKITASLQKASRYQNRAELDESIFEQGFSQLGKFYDQEYGGFGDQPKFPQAANIIYMLRYSHKNEISSGIHMATQTLDNMRKGGIWDHIGFGFHRYSTDRSWKLPHFEKMLYDQALLARAYIDGYLVTKKQLYSQTVKDIFTFVLRDLHGSEGGFYASVDADSQGEEGKYYLWTYQQLKETLNPEDFKLAVNVFNILPEGNISLENDLNILYINEDMDKISRKLKLPAMQLSDMTSGCLQKLLAARKKRQHPFIDPKILADWNGLMIAAMARGGRVLDRPIYIEAAKKAADFIIKNMIKEDRLYHCWNQGLSSAESTIDDYAYFIDGLLELYQSTFNLRYLKIAKQLNAKALELFWDEENGGFYYTSVTEDALIYRQKEASDTSLPSGNSVALLNMDRLSKLTSEPGLGQLGLKIIEEFSQSLKNNPQYHPFMLYAYLLLYYGTREVVVCGQSSADDSQNMINQLNRRYLPQVNVIFKPSQQDNTELDNLTGFTHSYICYEQKATAYVCTDFNCKFPTSDIEKMIELVTEE